MNTPPSVRPHRAGARPGHTGLALLACLALTAQFPQIAQADSAARGPLPHLRALVQATPDTDTHEAAWARLVDEHASEVASEREGEADAPAEARSVWTALRAAAEVYARATDAAHADPAIRDALNAHDLRLIELEWALLEPDEDTPEDIAAAATHLLVIFREIGLPESLDEVARAEHFGGAGPLLAEPEADQAFDHAKLTTLGGNLGRYAQIELLQAAADGDSAGMRRAMRHGLGVARGLAFSPAPEAGSVARGITLGLVNRVTGVAYRGDLPSGAAESLIHEIEATRLPGVALHVETARLRARATLDLFDAAADAARGEGQSAIRLGGHVQDLSEVVETDRLREELEIWFDRLAKAASASMADRLALAGGFRSAHAGRVVESDGQWVRRYAPVHWSLPSARQIEEDTALRARLDGLRVLLAVEHHREAHGSLPDSLDALTPEPLAELPEDILGGGGSLRYRQLEGTKETGDAAEGRGFGYTLYSVGPGGEDLGGRAAPDRRGWGFERWYRQFDVVFSAPPHRTRPPRPLDVTRATAPE